MIRLHTYKGNKQASASAICLKLVKFIKNYKKKNNILRTIVNEINNASNIPKETLNQKIYQILYKDFNFKKNKFINYSLIFLASDFLKYYLIIIVNLFSYFIFRKKIKIKNFELICDNVFNQGDVDRYTGLIKSFKNVCLLGKYSKKQKIKAEQYFKYRVFNLGESNQPLRQRFFYFFFGIKILFFSIIYRFNFFRISNLLIYDIFKSNHIFSRINAKYYFTNKFYDTSPIFNFYFKKTGGKKYSCFQKNLCAYSLSCFVFSDILFSLGKNQGKICNKLGGKIKKIIPVGSLFMENDWFNKKKDLKRIPNSDVLILGINTFKNSYHHVSNVYENDYYNIYLNWINKLVLDFPNLKILLKHHSNHLKDPKERRILSKTKLKILVKNESINSTYAYSHKSKLILSFASTMVLEMLGHGKNAFFVDPGLRGSQWFDDVKKINSFRIGKYEDLKELVVKRNIKKKIFSPNKNYYCLNSRFTSRRIAVNLKK